MRGAHRIESVGSDAVPSLHHAEAEQDRDRADMRNQQIEITRLADLGNIVIGGDQKIGRQRHRFPRHHEHIGIIRQQHQRHADEEQVIFEAHQTERVSRHGLEITRAIQGNTEGCAAQQDQEERRQRIETEMERQIGQAQRQHHDVGRSGESPQSRERQQQRSQRAERKDHAIDQPRRALQCKPCHSEGYPELDQPANYIQGQYSKGVHLVLLVHPSIECAACRRAILLLRLEAVQETNHCFGPFTPTVQPAWAIKFGAYLD